MNENEMKNRIFDCIAEGKSIYRICKEILSFLPKEQGNSDVLEYLFKEIYVHLNEKGCQLDEDEQRTLEEQINKYGKAWNEIMSTLLSERLSREEFYMKLWNLIVATPLFESEEARICILYLVCINMCIPYYKLQSDVQIEDEQYQEYMEELKDDIIRARSLVFQPCRRYTDRALALLEQLEQCAEREKKAVFLAQMIKMFELKGQKKAEQK